MELSYLSALPQGGFNFDNCIRNTALTQSNNKMDHPLKTTKTGTTICGIIYKVGTLEREKREQLKMRFLFVNNWLINEILNDWIIIHELSFSRMELYWLQTPVQLVVQLWETKTARRFTTSPLTFTAAVPVPLLIAIMSLVRNQKISEYYFFESLINQIFYLSLLIDD